MLQNWILFIVKVVENTPAVLSFGKFCDENGYSYEWINGQKPHLIKNHIRTPYNIILWIFIDFKDTFETGESFFVIFVHHLSSSSVNFG